MSSTLLALGDTLRLTAQVLDQDGRTIGDAVVTWRSSDDAVVAVDGTGLARAVDNGEVTITAAAGASASGTAVIAVSQTAAIVTLSPSADTLVTGDTVRATAEAFDANGHAMKAAGISWSSSDPAVARVDSTGLVTALSPGEAEITGSSGGGSGHMTLLVIAPTPTAILLTPDSLVLSALRDTVRVAAEVFDQAGGVIEGVVVSWSSADESVAAVDSTGLIVAISLGMTAVTASAGAASAEATVAVLQLVGRVVVSPIADTIAPGDTQRLGAEAFDANGHVIEGAEFSWSSNDLSVATVDARGLVTAVGAGKALIAATSGGVTGQMELEVVASAATVIDVVPDTVALTAVGDTIRLLPVVLDQFGRVVGDAAVSWSSGDQSVAAVDESGLVTARGTGNTRVIATSDAASGAATVYLRQIVDSVAVSPASAAISPRQTLRLSAAAFDANGHSVAGEFSWSSSHPGVATVDGSGLIEGIGEGVATVAAQVGGVRGSSQVAVGNPDRAGLTAFYAATEGASWARNDHWLTDRPLSEWHGVRLDGDGRVVRLILTNNNLSGRIPPELASLARLEQLDLRGNRLTGTIPRELAFLSRLENLELERNQLTGPIPRELASLARLEYLDLEQNQLTGGIPPEIGQLAALRWLELNDNQLTGPIPRELANLSQLQYLHIGRNALTGVIPPQLGILTRLTHLILLANDLTGPIPRELGNLTHLRALSLAANRLTGPIPPELAKLAQLEHLNVSQNELAGPIPPELGKLSRLIVLRGQLNQLTGTIPPEIGRLVELEWLDFSFNPLEGALPRSLPSIPGLGFFRFDATRGVCAPGRTVFVRWLENIDTTHGSFCNTADEGVLASLFEAAGGEGWTRSEGWLGGAALEEWHGVGTDSIGRVQELDLSRNGLVGRIPGSLARLDRLTVLRVGENTLSGPLPQSLARLHLRELRYADTGLCVPAGDSFQAWLNAIPFHAGTGLTCPPLSEREILATLYDATGGTGWSNRDGWLTDAQLDDWYGVRVDAAGHVVDLSLEGNRLTGSIPPQLGSLKRLTSLSLRSNRLTGSIPPQLGNLTNLRELDFNSNELTGAIPAELGQLARLERLSLTGNALGGPIPPVLGRLDSLSEINLGGNEFSGRIPPQLANLARLTILRLWGNRLIGPIPPEFGRLGDLELLNLHGNGLTGPIPSEVGDLENLKSVWLFGNRLSGGIPPRLGDLANLEELFLQNNELGGTVPPEVGHLASLRDLDLSNNRLEGSLPTEFGGLGRLTELRLSHNPELVGALPSSLTALVRLDTLWAVGTELCAPSDDDFQRWLAGVVKQRVTPCSDGLSLSTAYLTQTVQSPNFPVPLVADEPALLRVFATAPRPTSERIPAVRATFYLDGSETHVADIPAQTAYLPTRVDEGDLTLSANAEIPAEIVRPGLEMVVEIDPEGEVDARLGIERRIPATGRMAVDVQRLPGLDLTLIPFLSSEAPDSTIIDLVGAMASDPEGHELLSETRTLLPVADLRVTAHAPVVSGADDPLELVYEVEAIRVLEGGRGHYMGMNSDFSTHGIRGAAFVTGRASFSRPLARTMAHELGHNMSLRHAPCGGARKPDPDYPHEAGSIGAWGYDIRDGADLVPPERPDLMSYCFPSWISDYHFARALRYRLVDEASGAVAAVTEPAQSLLLWGGVDAEGLPFLNPVFVVDAPAVLPAPGSGEFEVTGRTREGGTLFSLRFDMPEMADADPGSAFVFALPAETGWAGELAAITLSGSNGTIALDGDTDRPMAILRDSDDGQVRAFLRGLPTAALARNAWDIDASRERGLEVLFSRGLPGPREWRR